MRRLRGKRYFEIYRRLLPPLNAEGSYRDRLLHYNFIEMLAGFSSNLELAFDRAFKLSRGKNLLSKFPGTWRFGGADSLWDYFAPTTFTYYLQRVRI
jgi:hypothetical protein